MPQDADDRTVARLLDASAADDARVEALGALLDASVPDDVAARHLALLAASPAPARNVVPLRRSHRGALRLGAAGLVVGATLVSGAGVAAASTSRPGDALYGLKTAREHLQLAMARPGNSRAHLELRLARTRLAEAAALLRHGDAHRAVQTLARADAALASARAQGGDEVDAGVAAELDHRVQVLGGLLDGGLPETASDAAREALTRAIDRGGRGHARPNGTGRGTPGGGKPDADPSAPPDAPGSPGTHPGPGNHPSGRPSAVPSRRR